MATQHSVPSGRYSLLGPDLHRLDRTSLRLAHLLYDLISPREERGRHVEPEGLRGLQVDHQSAEFEITLMVKWVTAKSSKG